MKLPEILAITEQTADSVTLSIGVAPEVCIGHFPGHPVVPGVVQLDWVMRLAGHYFPAVPPVAQDFQIKFRRIIQPGEPVALLLTWMADKNALTFTYSVEGATASSGRVKLP